MKSNKNIHYLQHYSDNLFESKLSKYINVTSRCRTRNKTHSTSTPLTNLPGAGLQ